MSGACWLGAQYIAAYPESTAEDFPQTIFRPASLTNNDAS